MIATANRLASVQEYYFSRKLREVAQMVQEGHPVINLGIGSPDLPPHPEVVKALSDAMVHPRANMYQSYQGLPELRSAIKRLQKRLTLGSLTPAAVASTAMLERVAVSGSCRITRATLASDFFSSGRALLIVLSSEASSMRARYPHCASV